MEMQNVEGRILSRKLARELTEEEIAVVSGGLAAIVCTRSSCTGSDNSSCDLDHCRDLE